MGQKIHPDRKRGVFRGALLLIVYGEFWPVNEILDDEGKMMWYNKIRIQIVVWAIRRTEKGCHPERGYAEPRDPGTDYTLRQDDPVWISRLPFDFAQGRSKWHNRWYAAVQTTIHLPKRSDLYEQDTLV